MCNRKRILQANINNQGGAFSLMFQIQKRLSSEVVFDYFSPNSFIQNSTYEEIKKLGSRCIDDKIKGNKIIKQFNIYNEFNHFLANNYYEIVHIHADTAWKIAAYLLAAKKAHVNKIIVHSHSSGINGHYRFLNFLLHLVMRPYVIRLSNHKCACSNQAARWMFCTEKNVLLIKNGVDINKYRFNKSNREKIRKRYKLNNIKIIGTVSDYSWAKNPQFLFRLIKKLNNNSMYKFLLIGDGKGRQLLEEKLVKNNLHKNVIFTGMVTNTEEYLSAMDIFILPSRFEGLPISALEAQINGLYTIVSNKITREVQCSDNYQALSLNLKTWIRVITHLDLNYSRSNCEEYENKGNILNAEQQLRKVYGVNGRADHNYNTSL